MSTDITAYIGYTVTLKTDLNADDFDFFESFLEAHGEYNLFDCEGKVLLAVDSMSGEYARFVFVDEHIRDYWAEEKEYYALRNSSTVPDDVYEELNKAYKAMYDKELDKALVKYALWFQFS